MEGSGDVVSLSLAMAPRLQPIIDSRPQYATVAAIMLGRLVLTSVTNESPTSQPTNQPACMQPTNSRNHDRCRPEAHFGMGRDSGRPVRIGSRASTAVGHLGSRGGGGARERAGGLCGAVRGGWVGGARPAGR